jgi:putative SOS response-associated peptidase YedK
VPRPVNAKAETASDAPMFRRLIWERRCPDPADWFSEWKVTPAGKSPYRVRLASKEPFFFAGLWDIWHPRKEDALRSFTIFTTAPNELTAKIHNPIPVIVPKEDYSRWLDPKLKDHEKR